MPVMPEDDVSIETRIDGIDDGAGRQDVEAGSPNLAVDEVEAEGGEGLEAAVLKTIFRFPPHTHDLVVHVHLQSGAIRSNRRSQSGFAISQSVASIRYQWPSVAISRNQSQPVAISRHQSRTAISVGTKSS
jgi:hypothetical protein